MPTRLSIMLNEYTSGDIYIKYAVDDEPDDKDFPMHIHELCEIYLFISGDVECLVEGTVYPLKENSLIIIRPEEAHRARIRSVERYERYAVNFSVSLINRIDPENRLLKPFFDRKIGTNNILTAEDIDIEIVKKLFSQMCGSADDYGKRLTFTTHIYMLTDMISRAFAAKKDTRNTTFQTIEQRMVMYVNEHLFDELSVPMLAEHFYLSTSQFSRVFRKATGASPWEYITRKRLIAAREKIQQGFSAYSASEQCGFSDYSAFYRAYVKHFGCGPKG